MEFYAKRVERVTCNQCGCAFDTAQAMPLGTQDCPECGTPVRIPARFDGHFLITELLGRGTSGVVFKAFDEQLHRYVAIKVLRKGSAEEEKIALECIREARALAALNDPGIIQIYSIGKYREQHYIVMELGTKGRADKYFGTERKLDEAQVLEMGMSVAGGLAAASCVGLVHMDVKPGNILLASGHKAKLIDFGAAQYAQRDRQVRQEEEGQSGQAMIGTPYYIAPEVVRGQDPDIKADIYSLGATLFHLLAGRPPFPGHRTMDVIQQRLKRPAPWILDVRRDLHAETAQVIAKMLATDPNDRYQNYRQLIDALREAHAAAREGPANPLEAQLARMAAGAERTERAADRRSATIDEPVKKKGLSGKTILAIMLGVIVLLAGGGYLVVQQARPGSDTPSGRTAELPTSPPPAPPNLSPVAVAPQITVPGTTPGNRVVGAIEAKDPNPDDQLSYEVLSEPDQPALLKVDASGQLIVTDSAALMKAGESAVVRVRVSDNADPPGRVIVDVPLTIIRPDVLTYRLVARWPLDKNGTDAGGGYNGKLYGDPKFVQSQAGYPAAQLNGNDAIVVPHDPSFTGDDMTVCCWVRMNRNTRQKEDAGLVTKGPTSWCLELNGLESGQFRFSVGPSVRVVTEGTQYNDSEWRHLVAVKQGAELWIYVDGKLDGYTRSILPATPTNEQGLWIGGNPIGKTEYGLRGYLSDVRLYRRAMNAVDVAKLYELLKK